MSALDDFEDRYSGRLPEPSTDSIRWTHTERGRVRHAVTAERAAGYRQGDGAVLAVCGSRVHPFPPHDDFYERCRHCIAGLSDPPRTVSTTPPGPPAEARPTGEQGAP